MEEAGEGRHLAAGDDHVPLVPHALGDRRARGDGNLLTLRDAENQTTSYEYDVRNLKTQETYPDHVSGSAVGTAGYGIVEFTYDPARRVQRKTDQLGDTVTYVFDLAGRLTQRDYRTRVNSPSGPIADSDVFTYDLASRVLTAVSGRYTNTVTETYDGIGRLKTEALTYRRPNLSGHAGLRSQPAGCRA